MNRIQLASHVLFSYAFRPFFLLVGAYAVLIVPAWGFHLGGMLAWPNAVPASLRHGHEMISGFAGGAIAGFLLTAVATWTGRSPVAGAPLIALCTIWIMARVGAWLPGTAGLELWTWASLLFWAGLCLLVSRTLIGVRNTRNYKVLALLAAFLTAEAYFFSALGEPESLHRGLRIELCLVIGMILLIGGRIIPSFTQNWLRVNRPALTPHLPAFDRLDAMAVGVTGLFAPAFVLWPSSSWSGAIGLAASALQFIRLARWRGGLTRSEPLLWVLHVGYCWIPIGLALLGASMLLGHAGLWDGGLHALGYGAIGTLILGVAARVALGHTGRSLRASPSMTAAFAMIILGTLFRLLAPLAGLLMGLSIILWVAAYLLFLVHYLPILLAPRVSA